MQRVQLQADSALVCECYCGKNSKWVDLLGA
jgi:hypothetical protein